MTAHEELFDMLRTMPDSDAHEVLQRIKAGMQPDDILRLVRDGNLFMQLFLTPECRHRYDFPYLRDMPAYLLTPTNLYLDTLVYDYPLRRKPIDITPESRAGALQSVYLTPYHAAEMIEPKLDSCEPSHWTLVCSDDKKMRRLLKGYFLSEYHTLPMFQKVRLAPGLMSFPLPLTFAVPVLECIPLTER
jgi:hypothetical protein